MSRSSLPKAFTGALATPHALATEVGVGVLRDGGSAIDSAIAAAAVLTVIYPHNVALGGDLVALVRSPDGTVMCVNASGWAGKNVDVRALRDKYGAGLPLRGADTVTVPGGVRGWEALRSLGSRLSWARTLAPAAEIAESRIAVPSSLAFHIDDPDNRDLWGTADFDRVFRPSGQALRTGEDFRQPQLAATLRALCDGGPDAFYRGALAERFVEFLRSGGSQLTVADFADFVPELCVPLSATFDRLTVITSPPNTHGFLLLRALHDLGEDGIDSALGSGFGRLMESFRRGNTVRTQLLADPRHEPVDVDTLMEVDLPGPAHTTGAGLTAGGDTVGISAVDSDGYAISLIQSVYDAFGSGLLDPQTGVLFHSRGRSFSLDDKSPNVIAPRKRPLHTLMPTMTLEQGHVRHVLSTMGGQGQPQIIAQLLLRALQGAGAHRAVAAPRAIIGQNLLGADAETVCAELDVEDPARDALADSGLSVTWVPPHSEGIGQANVVFVDAEKGMTAASDPRSDGAAVVVHFPRHHV